MTAAAIRKERDEFDNALCDLMNLVEALQCICWDLQIEHVERGRGWIGWATRPRAPQTPWKRGWHSPGDDGRGLVA